MINKKSVFLIINTIKIARKMSGGASKVQ